MSEELNWHDNYDAKFEELFGKTITEIEGRVGDDTMTFLCSDGTKYQLHYYPDCCANASVEDICGDMKDLIDSPILLAEEVSSESPTPEILKERQAEYDKEKNEPYFWYSDFEHYCSSRFESETWTFYKLVTVNGAVTIRWYGSSNGYYSEKATFERLAQ